jgi:hypothetical protein
MLLDEVFNNPIHRDNSRSIQKAIAKKNGLFASEADDPAWSYESVLNIYRRIEDWHGAPDPKYRGTGGRFFSNPCLTPAQLLWPCLKEHVRSGSQPLKIRTVV